MGCVKTITATTFPEQSDHVKQRVSVYFMYDTSKSIEGTIVRDDLEEPFETIIQLDDGRIVLATECQHSFIDWRSLMP